MSRRSRSLPSIKEYSSTTRSKNNETTNTEKRSRYQEDFIELGLLGKGGFGAVYKVRNLLDGIEYAVKKIEISRYSRKVQREVRSLALLDHRNVCRYYQAWIEDKPEESPTKEEERDSQLESTTKLSSGDMSIEFATPSYDYNAKNEFKDCDSSGIESKSKKEAKKKRVILYIQMQLYLKTLRDILDAENRSIVRKNNLTIFKQIEYIHSHHIIHRDLKPDNIFISSDHSGEVLVRIGDFGLSTTYDSSHHVSNSVNLKNFIVDTAESATHTTGVGTLTYSSPEQLKCEKYNEKTDIYSLGVILYEMFSIFTTNMERVVSIKNLRNHILPSAFSRAYPREGAFILSLLSNNPDDRPSARDILESSLLSNDDEELYVLTPKRELLAMKQRLEQQENIIKQQESLLQQLKPITSPKKVVKRRLQMDESDKENNPAFPNLQPSPKKQIHVFRV